MALGASGRVVTASSLPACPVLLRGPRGAALGLLSRGTQVAVRGEQESESRSFWSTSKIPEDNLPWQGCPQPPPWHGVPVRSHHTPAACLPSWAASTPSLLRPTSSSSPPASHCSKGPLLWGVSSNPGTGCAGSSLPTCPSAPERDSGRSC